MTWLRDRLREVSTRAGLLCLLLLLVPFFTAAELAEYAARIAQVGGIGAALVAILTEEGR